jgi:2-dehydro-3-deoxy-L-rhamnonate dehydrogenase (NAD+)
MNQIDLKGRVAAITGGARGIGFAIAERFLASGASVALWDVDPKAMEEASAALSKKGKVDTRKVDVTDLASIEAAVKGTEAALGPLAILVNNAGITGGNGKTWELDPAVWRQVVDVNLIGPFLCSRAVIPGMVERKYGRVVNIASVAGKEGNPNASHYSASKAGLIALTKSLGKELAQAGVLVNCVTPAAAKTDIFKQMAQVHIDYMLSRIPMGRFVEIQEIAAMVTWLASEDCSFSTGAVFDITGGRATY